jgi:hypothetical protein
MRQKMVETPAAAWEFLILGLGMGGVLAYLSAQIGIPFCIALIIETYL